MKTKDHKNNKTKKENGVALLFVILLTSVLLMVTLGISNITYKELVFSLEARDSDKAFFAADTGIECALYLDKFGAFDATLPSHNCNGAPVVVTITSADNYQFAIPLGQTCSNVLVNTALDPYGTGELHTSIQSFGYNTSVDSTTGECPDGSVSSRVVSRGLSVAFPNGGTGTGTTSTATSVPILSPGTTVTFLPGGNIKMSGSMDITSLGATYPMWPIVDVGFDIYDSGGVVGVTHIAAVSSVTGPVTMPTLASPGFEITFDPSGFPLVSGTTYTVGATAHNGVTGYGLPITSFTMP
jgi:hypothetical protein